MLRRSHLMRAILGSRIHLEAVSSQPSQSLRMTSDCYWGSGETPAASNLLTQSGVLPDSTLRPHPINIVAHSYPPGVISLLQHSAFYFLFFRIHDKSVSF